MVTPELALMGYLPRDLLMNQGFVRRGCQKLSQIAEELQDAPPVLVGVATPNPVGRRAPFVQQRGAGARRRGGAGLSQIAAAHLRRLR